MASPRARQHPAPSGQPAFADRTEAGTLLGAAVRAVLAEPAFPERGRGSAVGAIISSAAAGGHPASQPCVFALPRGGVPVATGVASALGATLDVLIVRKIGHPAAPELGLGAIAEDGAGGALEPLFDEEMIGRAGISLADLADVVIRERAELARRAAVYQRGRGRGQDLAGRLAIVVDDGLATGVTARAALRAVRARGPARTMLAVPVAAAAAVRAVKKETDEVVTLVTPRRFLSVGEWYADFGQLTDADVLTLLAAIP